MRSDFDSVGDFHQKFGLDNTTHQLTSPHEISDDLRDFRIAFLLEELTELCEGYGLELNYEITANGKPPDLARVADALVDLSYVTLGLAHMHGLPWPELFAEVQRANMTKERAKADGSNSTRKSGFDVVKPEGWTPPDIEGVLKKAGWQAPGEFKQIAELEPIAMPEAFRNSPNDGYAIGESRKREVKKEKK